MMPGLDVMCYGVLSCVHCVVLDTVSCANSCAFKVLQLKHFIS